MDYIIDMFNVSTILLTLHLLVVVLSVIVRLVFVISASTTRYNFEVIRYVSSSSGFMCTTNHGLGAPVDGFLVVLDVDTSSLWCE